MRWAVTIRRGTGNVPFFRRLAMNLVLERLSRLIHWMALQTHVIRIGLVELRGPVSRRAPIVGIIIPDVLHTADFREDRAKHAIIGMTDITAFIAEVWVFAMNRGERRAVRIGGIVRVNGHGMARRAKLAFRRHLEIRHIAGHCGGDRQGSEANEKP